MTEPNAVTPTDSTDRPGDPLAPTVSTGQGAPVAPTPPFPDAPGAGAQADGAPLAREFLDYFALYRLPTGRRLFALSRVAEAAERRGVTALDPMLADALEADRRTHRIELAWRRTGGRPLHGPQAGELDRELDRALGAFDELLAGQVKAFGEESERGRTATALREALFPGGVFAVISLSYVEEHEIVTILVARLRDPADLAPLVKALGLEELVARLGELNTRYGEELRSPAGQLSFERIRALRDRGQVNLLRVVTRILALFPWDAKADAEARAELLRPIADQNEAVRLRRQRRRGAADVDPSTGEEEDPLPTEPEPADVEPAPEVPTDPASAAAPSEPPEADAA